MMKAANRLVLVFAVLVSCIGCDQATKLAAKSYLQETHAKSLLADTIRLQVTKNYGAFLSLGTSLPLPWRFLLLTAGVALLLTAILAFVILSKGISPFVVAAGALIAGGGFSNLFDRIAYGGYVVDFMNLGLGPLRTGIFNVADLCILMGILLWAIKSSATRSV